MKAIFAAGLFLLLAATTTAYADDAISDATRCTNTGGVVQTRIPEYGTNNPNPLVLANPRKFCAYTAKNGSCYCSQIGGTDEFGGITAAGGAWVDASDPINPDLDTCIFPDESSIDAYGLFYHSAGIIRGKNLDGRLAYKNPYAPK